MVNNSRNFPKVGAGAVIVKNGKVLLAKRRGAHSGGSWGSVGGHVELAETPVETVKREALEELGIKISNIKFRTALNLIREEKHYLDISFTADIASGKPKIMEPDKIEKIGWYPLDKLPEPLFEPVRVVLENLKTGQNYFEVSDL